MRESDIKYFKDLLNERKRQLLANIEATRAELESIAELEGGDEGDVASCNSSGIVDSALNLKQRRELVEIEEALSKFEKGTYGICEMCEDPIGIQRLKVKPHAKYCIKCREIIEKEKNKD